MAKARTYDKTDVFVGQRVRMARLLAKMSQMELGDALGVSFQQVQKYEKGANRIGSSRMQKIAETLGRPVSWFFNETADAANPAKGVVERMLVVPGGVKLAEAYLGIEHSNDKHAVLVVAEALARAREAA